ncbi:MAG TPA: cupin domain-containing protein [Alphaproteobacteria bacterium]|nr:cupin domain-containing protein [Alphaproteobacteria bacterium]
MTKPLQLPALDPATVSQVESTGYPEPYRASVAGRKRRRLGDAAGLTQFGVNEAELAPGTWSSQRHWHAAEDEFVYVLDGELVLITDAGEQVLTPGMAAGFPKGKRDGHHLVNRSEKPARYLEIGTRAAEDRVEYPDIDMICVGGGRERRYLKRDSSSF